MPKCILTSKIVKIGWCLPDDLRQSFKKVPRSSTLRLVYTDNESQKCGKCKKVIFFRSQEGSRAHFAEQQLTVEVVHQGVGEAFQLVPERRGNVKVRQLRNAAAFFGPCRRGRYDV